MGKPVPPSLHHLISEGKALWPLTSMRVGGAVRWLAAPKTVSDIDALLAWIQEQCIPHVVLGGGTNILFGDDGYPGIVIRMDQLKGIQINGTSAVVAAGERLSELARTLNRKGLSGLEWACGIPGTIGGAVVMNAGTREGDMSTVIESVRVLTKTGILQLSEEQLALGYRTSALRSGSLEGIVLGVALKLQQDDPGQCIAREQTFLELRHTTQPAGASCGCIFKNPETGPPAGILLDRAGCKGIGIGAAAVSDLHANFIINKGSQNAADVLALMNEMKRRVLDMSGIELEQEVVVC